MNNLIRNYKVRALVVKSQDTLLMATDSRDRARDFFLTLNASSSYSKVWVELGDKVYDGKNLEELP